MGRHFANAGRQVCVASDEEAVGLSAVDVDVDRVDK